MRGKLTATTATLLTLAAICAAPANAGDDCQSAPIPKLNPPQVRTICDTAINPDGSWMRIREFWYLQGQDKQGPLIDSDIYTVTLDTIPAGEPPHLG